MRALKRAGASLLALGVVAAGMVMTAPIASAHTGTLATASVCQSDGTYKITYTGTTVNVPASGAGHVATLTIGEIKPLGTTIADAPATVTGNTSYTFTQTVPGTARQAQATAFLKWGDGANSDPIGQTTLAGNCTVPVAPSGSYTTACTATGASVVVGTLTSGSHDNVVWTLTYGDQHKVVSSGARPSRFPAGAALDLSYKAGDRDPQRPARQRPHACPPEIPADGS